MPRPRASRQVRHLRTETSETRGALVFYPFETLPSGLAVAFNVTALRLIESQPRDPSTALPFTFSLYSTTFYRYLSFALAIVLPFK